MPSWIKKMQNLFMNKISSIPKPETFERAIQTYENKSEKELKEEQMKDLK
jgi:hypothetical protein